MKPLSLAMKIVIGIVILWAVAFGATRCAESGRSEERAVLEAKIKEANARAVAADERNAKLLKDAAASANKAAEWEKQAKGHEATANGLRKKLKAAEAYIASLGPLAPPTDVGTTPTTTTALAASFANEGLPPIPFIPTIQGADLGFSVTVARPMLALVQDGKAYPKALEKVTALEDAQAIADQHITEVEAALQDRTNQAEEATTAYHQAVDANSACKEEVRALTDARDAEHAAKVISDKQVRTEKVKKVLWGGAGVGIGWLLKALVVLL